MAVNPSTFGPCPQFENAAGEPAVGDKLFFYAAGTTTKQNTYTNSTGSVANTNPIILDALGQPSTEIWFTNGDLYKMVWAPSTDTDPPTNPIRTFDNLRGINDTTAAPAASEWVLSTQTPTYVSGTSFTVPGNQTATLTTGRRLKTTNTSGTIYSSITNSVYTTLTTITVVNDSGSLDSGLSVLYYGLLSAVNQSIPPVPNLGGGSAGVIPYQSASGMTAFSAVGAAGQPILSGGTGAPTFGSLQSIISMPDPTLASNAMTLPASTHSLDFRSPTLGTGLVTTVSGTASALVIPSGATLGTLNGVRGSIIEVIMNNGGLLEKAVVNLSGGNDLSENGVISTTAISAAATASNVFYSNTARTNLAYRVVRKIDFTQATAGTWATAPSLIQGYGGQALASMSSLGFGQTYQNVAASRAVGVTYYNTNGKPMFLVIGLANASASGDVNTITVNGTAFVTMQTYGAGNIYNMYAIVPPYGSYVLASNQPSTIHKWYEFI